MRSIRTTTEIHANARSVWDVLIDWDAYPSWNPLIRSAETGPIRGESGGSDGSPEGPQEGERITVRIQLGDGRPLRLRPRLLRVRPEVELRWKGSLGVPGLFDGEHVFRIEGTQGGTSVRFVHEELFSGILVPLLWSSLEARTRAGFEAMNQALKARVEQGGGGP